MGYKFNPFSGTFDIDTDVVGAITSVSNSDGTLTISPTTGAVVASINLANANTWIGQQTFSTSPVRLGSSTGASITGSAGKLTMAGIGNTNNEDLTFDFETTANNVLITSSTGVTGVAFTGLTNFAVGSAVITTSGISWSKTVGNSGTFTAISGGETNNNNTVGAAAVGIAGTGNKQSAVGGNSFTAVGVKGTGQYSSTGTQVDVIGVYGIAAKTTSASGSITDAFSLFGDLPTASGGGTITRSWGLGLAAPIGFTSALGTAPDTTIARNAAGVLDFRYDVSNYLRLTISSAGAITLDAVGASAGFTFSDALTATSLIKSGGLSTEFLKADGSVDSSTYFVLPSFTAGSILFSNGSTIAQDNANFFWDDTNNRLGLGTATPASLFHMVGADNYSSSGNRIFSNKTQTLTVDPGNSYIHDYALTQVAFTSDVGRTIQGTNFQVNVAGSVSTVMPNVNMTANNASITYAGTGEIGTLGGGSISVAASGSGPTGTITGGAQSATISGTHTTATVTGSSLQGTISNAGATVTTLQGASILANQTAAATTTTVEGLRVRALNTAGAINTSLFAMRVVTWGITSGAGSVSNAYGLSIGAITNTGTITNAFGLNIGSMTGAGTHTNVPYGLYVTGSSDYNSITGNTIIGSGLANPIPTSTGSMTIVNKGVANSQLVLRSQRAAIVSTNVLGGIDFQSDDTNLTAPGTVVSAIQSIATVTHTASTLSSDLVFYGTSVLAFAEGMRLTGSGNLGIGTGSTVSAKAHVVSTTEQIRTGYDSSNYYSTTVGSTGGVTFDAVGTGASFTFSDGIRLPYVAKTGNYTLTASDYTVNCTSGTFALTLPTAVGATGQVYNLKNSGTGVITINTTSSQTIDGNASGTLTLAQYDNLTVQSDGANWIIL